MTLQQYNKIQIRVNLSEKWFLITGASSGLGKACARYLDSCGAHTILVAQSADKLNELAGSMKNDVLVRACDLSIPGNMEDAIKGIAKQGIKLDGLVYAAGVAPSIPIAQYDYETILRMFNVNFYSFCEALKCCSKKKYMNASASIVAVSACAVRKGNKAQAAYVASKSALEGYIRIAALELIDKGIRINAIQPAALDTPMTAAAFASSSKAEDYIKEFQKLGIINPDVLAEFVGFLLSDAACYMTGLCIPIDAGYLHCNGI